MSMRVVRSSKTQARAGTGGNVAVGDSAVVDGAGGGDDMLARMSAMAAVSPRDRGRGHEVLHSCDVAGRYLVQAAFAPDSDHADPVAAVGADCAGSGGGDDVGQVLGQRRDGRGGGGVLTMQILKSDPELLGQHAIRSGSVLTVGLR